MIKYISIAILLISMSIPLHAQRANGGHEATGFEPHGAREFQAIHLRTTYDLVLRRLTISVK